MRKVSLATIVTLLPAFSFGQTLKASPPLLLDASLEDLRSGLDQGVFTSVDLVQTYIARIKETHHALRAVVEINPDALAIAAQLDRQRAEARPDSPPLGPLHGIPVLVKDNMATADGMNTTAGSFALVGARPANDSTVVSKLRKAGAIILGKTNMSQWASSRSGSIPEGWSAVGGQTFGAYFPGQNPSGSSSGSAVGTSIGLAWAALGSETTTSIIQPAHINNCVGIKPTLGLTSRHLVVPFSTHQDSVGPIARTVKDAAHLLAAIAGPDVNDNYTTAIPFHEIPDYVAACKPDALRGKRIGVVRNAHELFYDEATETSLEAFNNSLNVLRDAGAQVIDNIMLQGIQPLIFGNYQFNILAADLYSNLPEQYVRHLQENPQNITSLQDLVNFTKTSPKENYPTYDTQFWDIALNMAIDVDSSEFWSQYSAAIKYSGPLGITGALQQYSLDALVMPSLYASLTASIIGTPVISVPLGKSPNNSPVIPFPDQTSNITAPNQPFGIGFAGLAFSEESLIGLAYAFEQKTQIRTKVKPIIRPTTELADILTRPE
ncbi:hypothetical protein CDD81_2098 [Ophiocordyceps australis]|uniref:Amidase domain-containing protein n=1 Tax=Ophiocordyceps australis TaxID=1399860 RepID=A0A2C5XYE0_9HYPO|nr:hypothetical protein CDD81_2098 [Ophiocordyceps australis]